MLKLSEILMLDKLTYSDTIPKKHQDRIDGDSGIFKNMDISQFMSSPPARNSSNQTLKEMISLDKITMNLKFILLIPIIEILLFILLGDFFGFFLVVFLIILTGTFGIVLLRSNISLNDIRELALEPNEWVYKKIAGILLIIPGFFTDLLGIILLIRHLRSIVWNLLINKKNINPKKKSKNGDDIIEVEYRDLDDK